MLERVVKLCNPLAATVAVLHNPVTLPTEEEWLLLQEFCKILKPFEVVTVEMSSEKQITLSKVILIIKGVLSSLKRIRVQITSQLGRDLIRSLLASITTRFGNPENNTIMGKSSFLDPIFKTKGFNNDDCLKKVKDRLQEELVEIIKKSQQDDTVPEPSNDTHQLPLTETLSTETDDIIWQDFDNLVKSSNTVTSPTAVAIAELKMFSEEANLERKQNPLLWWKEREKIYPWLAVLAKKYLSVLATSVPCERVFSKTDQDPNKSTNSTPAQRTTKKYDVD
ncbi:unnamed protein product [Diabrotica balteata]|uniref:HAT C-terminal dimerisation domain-containing protein n=1 Tax=Diabrotica balteata TaxID=107213 RepID=A0A9N9TD90_DIABA|nr:unnamed protein product [Diabrotica balteata]